jgi:hypothetical protein
MSIFDLHSSVVQDYQRYVRSFLSIADTRIREFVEKKLIEENIFWPDALLQLNPSYQQAETVAELATSGLITTTTADIFRDEKGNSIRLHKHQSDAVRIAARGESYVVTSGTGSGKSLTYFIPIFDAILRGDHPDPKVWAMIIYPMNALVNSQFEALKALALSYQACFGRTMPVRFDKYTGQEDDCTKNRIQRDPPHILLTNFMMLEMMLVRPQEASFVDRTTSGVRFLVLDEMHMYRGRQGADVAMLVRRLKERCGNSNILHIGTSATMIADRSAAGKQRRLAVAEFAGKLFGTALSEQNIIEETLIPVSRFEGIPTTGELEAAVASETPSDPDELLQNALTAWVEHTVGIRKDQEGIYRRQIPQSLTALCQSLVKDSRSTPEDCGGKLREVFLKGSRTVFAFKLHQFFSQGRSVYATLDSETDRFFSLDGQYYAPAGRDSGMQRLLFPVLFCRVCGQEYFKVVFDEAASQVAPWDDGVQDEDGGQGQRGYVLPHPGGSFQWSNEDLPPEWVQANGRVVPNYRNHIPRLLYVQADGTVMGQPSAKTIQVFYQPSPFLICQACGEYYTLRDRDFRKLTGLSNEGRSSATTTLSITSLDHAAKAHITGPSRKILSFTDNRQDASLQAGHFNDFVLVGLLRSAIYKALDVHGELRHYNIAEKTKEALRLELQDIAHNPKLDANSPAASNTWRAFQDLIQYRIYEDLRRAWRVVHPNLEQCGLLRIDYEGLEQACHRDEVWRGLLPMAARPAEERLKLVRPLLDFARRKLAIHAETLRETYQQQLRQRVNQLVNDRWAFDDSEERLRAAEKLILPGQAGRLSGISLGTRSLVWRFLRRSFPEISDYNDFLLRLVSILANQGLLRQDLERGVQYVQLDSSVLIWRKGDGIPAPPDPIYSRRAVSPVFVQVQQKSNEFFKELYESRGQSLRDVEGLEHTAQIKYENREERERRFRAGDLKVLFCSPTMELGIDIRDLQLVHLRNVPPTPASGHETVE